MDLLSPLDLHQNELRNFRLQNLAAAPATPVNGQAYFDTTLDIARVYVESTDTWESMLGGGGGGPLENGSVTLAHLDDAAEADLRDRSTHTGFQSTATILGLDTTIGSLQDDLDSKVSVDQANAPGGYPELDGAGLITVGTLPVDVPGGIPSLDGAGKIASNQLPALAITTRHPVASEAAMLALVAEEGDVAIRSDISKSFILGPGSPTLLASWSELLSPTDGVQNVTGAAPITSTGGANPQIGLANGGIQTAHVGDDQVTRPKLAQAVRDELVGKGTVSVAMIGDGVNSIITVNHGLNNANRDVIVQVRRFGTSEVVIVDTRITSTTQVQFDFGTYVPAANEFRAVFIGQLNI